MEAKYKFHFRHHHLHNFNQGRFPCKEPGVQRRSTYILHHRRTYRGTSHNAYSRRLQIKIESILLAIGWVLALNKALCWLWGRHEGGRFSGSSQSPKRDNTHSEKAPIDFITMGFGARHTGVQFWLFNCWLHSSEPQLLCLIKWGWK